MKKKSIVYLNYSPYENAGHILEFLLDNYSRVYLFSIAHHRLGNKGTSNKLTHYEKGRKTRTEYLPYMNIPDKFVVLFMPIRSIVNALQIILKILEIKKNIGIIDDYFTVNAFTASIGRLLKLLGIVNRTIFWVWDYYPLNFPTLTGKIMRLIYWQFDKFATYSDQVFYLSQRLADVRVKRRVVSKNSSVEIVPIGVDTRTKILKKRYKDLRIGFLGVIKKSQGIEMLLEGCDILEKYFKRLTFEIIGSGPDEAELRLKAPFSTNIKYNFYGYLSEEEISSILSNSLIGVAPYKPEKGSVSKFTDPAKLKKYIEFGIPVITTNVVDLSVEITKKKAGVVIEYGDCNGFAKAINKIIKNYGYYVKGVKHVREKYDYKIIYQKMFS